MGWEPGFIAGIATIFCLSSKDVGRLMLRIVSRLSITIIPKCFLICLTY